MDENDIYNVVAGIYDSIDTLGHDKKNELDLDFAASVTAVPYHKGAAKYFAGKRSADCSNKIGIGSSERNHRFSKEGDHLQ